MQERVGERIDEAFPARVLRFHLERTAKSREESHGPPSINLTANRLGIDKVVSLITLLPLKIYKKQCSLITGQSAGPVVIAQLDTHGPGVVNPV